MEDRYSSDVAFTAAVKTIQTRKGSRAAYARMEARGGWQTEISAELAEFVTAQRSFFIATANLDGQPYVQHRGGPPGFLRVLDPHTLAFADYTGNRQYITLGNLAVNPRAHAAEMPGETTLTIRSPRCRRGSAARYSHRVEGQSGRSSRRVSQRPQGGWHWPLT